MKKALYQTLPLISLIAGLVSGCSAPLQEEPREVILNPSEIETVENASGSTPTHLVRVIQTLLDARSERGSPALARSFSAALDKKLEIKCESRCQIRRLEKN